MIKKAGGQVVHDDREWGKEQHRIKTDFVCSDVAALEPDWVLFLDMDEVPDERFTRQKAEELAGKPYDICYHFWIMELWDDEEHYREDYTFETPRFFRFIEDPRHLNFFPIPLHCGNVPELHSMKATHSDQVIKHYGLIERQTRERKYERYQKYDPNGVYMRKEWYDSLLAKNPPIRSIEEFYQQKIPPTLHKKKAIHPFNVTYESARSKLERERILSGEQVGSTIR